MTPKKTREKPNIRRCPHFHQDMNRLRVRPRCCSPCFSVPFLYPVVVPESEVGAGGDTTACGVSSMDSAWARHSATHAAQNRQSWWLMCAMVSTVMASTGQTRAHAPQPVHWLSFTMICISSGSFLLSSPVTENPASSKYQSHQPVPARCPSEMAFAVLGRFVSRSSLRDRVTLFTPRQPLFPPLQRWRFWPGKTFATAAPSS